MADTTNFGTVRDLVATFPERGSAPAIIAFGSGSADTLSYDALHRDIRRVAAGFKLRGIGPGDTVLLWAPNSPAWVAAWFGIVENGATAIPADDQYRPDDIVSILNHRGAELVVTTASHMTELLETDRVPEDGFVLLDGAQSDPRSFSSLIQHAAGAPLKGGSAAGEGGPTSSGDHLASGQDALPSGKDDSSGAHGSLPFGDGDAPGIEASQVASLLYTSGTTGTPKAVPLTHGNLASNVNALLRARLIRATDRVAVPLPFHHTYPFTVGLLTVLGSGAVVVLPSGVSGPELTRATTEARATALLAVPALCAALCSAIEARVAGRGKRAARIFGVLMGVSMAVRRATGLRLGKLFFRPLHKAVGARLSMLGCGGAKLDGELARKLEGLGWTVLTGYGLTETSPVVTFNHRRKRRIGTEGRPLPGVDLRIEPVAGQAHGEILVRGPNVFAGYWNNPEATREVFTEDGWFRTGDLGWCDAGGFLHIAGRNKEVIVLPDGKNVFPDEVEAVYATSPLLGEFAVLEKDGELVALAVPDEDELRQRGALREAELVRDDIERLSMSLPAYKRIGDYRLTRDALPRTALGKLKRHLLPDIYAGANVRERVPAAAPLSDDDKRLIESGVTGDVWRWLAERYPDETLFLDTSPQLDLKVDSLEWVTMTLEIERRFGIVLTGEAVAQILTLRDLLEQVRTAPAAEVKPAGEPESVLPEVERPNIFLRALGALLFAVDSLLMRTLFRLRVRGGEHLPGSGAPCVIAANHVSFLDPPAIAAALPKRLLRETHWAAWVGIMFAGPLQRLVSRATRVFAVDPDQDLAGAIRTGRAVLAAGQSLVWFPEGRRSHTGELQYFQQGIGVMLESVPNAQVVPTAIAGAYEAWPRHRRLPRPGRVTVVFGPPLGVAELRQRGAGATDAERIANALQQEVARLLDASSGTPVSR